MPDRLVLRLALPVPLYQLFDYLPPADCDPSTLRPGVRVRVRLGRRRLVGLLVETAGHSEVPAPRLRAAEAILDPAPLLTASQLELLRWAAGYYHHPLGEVLAATVPSALRRPVEPRRPRHWRVTAAGAGADPDTLVRAPRQRELLARLQASPGGLAPEVLASELPHWRQPMAALAQRGWVEAFEAPVGGPVAAGPARPPVGAAGTGPGRPELHPDQVAAVARVRKDLGHFAAHLLYGVTGSGKTEVYLHLIEAVLEQGRQALVLVPEIGLTPQLLRRFRARLPAPLVALHSGLAAAERLRAWRAAATGAARIVVGTRSAVLAPLPEPGLIVLDEEHDPSFKQQEGFRYSARDLALVRGRLEGVPVVLGSATPSLETLHNANTGRYHLSRLQARAGGAEAPRMRILDVRGLRLDEGLSPPLIDLARRHLDAGGQVLFFLNRRGFAPTLLCHACGWIAGCPRCDARLTLHRAAGELRCHHCDRRQPVPAACPRCGADELLPLGQGTERLEAALARHFPGQAVTRIDRDSTRRRGALEAGLEAARSGSSRILVGTQMLAKGHHLPGVTLVAVVDADRGLFSADFRGPERMAQQILQVAGRAGRGERPGEVVVQTHQPEHPLFRHLARHDYDGFAAEELEQRRQARLPPFGHLALLRAEASDPGVPERWLDGAARRLQGVPELQVLGPAPAPMERRQGRWRWQLLLQARRRRPLHQALDRLVPELAADPASRQVRWSLDVDPQDVL